MNSVYLHTIDGNDMILDKIKALFGIKPKANNTSTRFTGKVRNINFKKGFGFIESDEHGKVFVHFSDSKTKLKPGKQVTFKVIQEEKGLKAIEVESANA